MITRRRASRPVITTTRRPGRSWSMRWAETPMRCWVCWMGRSWAARRVRSAEDPDARHGRKAPARGFDGYKGQIAVDPDPEIIPATGVTPGNSGDAEAAEDLLADMLPGDQDSAGNTAGTGAGVTPAGPGTAAAGNDQAAVYGDAAYGTGELLERIEDAGLHNGIKGQPPAAGTGHFAQDRFAIDLGANTVTFPAGVTVPITARARGRHAGAARVGPPCRSYR